MKHKSAVSSFFMVASNVRIAVYLECKIYNKPENLAVFEFFGNTFASWYLVNSYWLLVIVILLTKSVNIDHNL
jgi:hypothetical protein